ncbi:MAG TPA: Uma2 family endonuclease [Isosphaeraceae bacterium]|nr:Uma2 family endonuclease [Isosphaeraceae bacterium]
MSIAASTSAPAGPRTVADLLEALRPLGDIPPERIRLHPAPGTATEQDLLDVLDHENRICELVEGTLVEKTMGYEEGRLAGVLLTYLNIFLWQHDLGIANGPDGTLKLTTGLIRIPDVSFVSWDRLPNRQPPKGPIPHLALDLAVEVISQGNTRAEMDRKLLEYFDAGTRLVWFVYPKTRTVRVYTSPRDSAVLTADDHLDGGDVLPGFSVSVNELFARAGIKPGA